MHQFYLFFCYFIVNHIPIGYCVIIIFPNKRVSEMGAPLAVHCEPAGFPEQAAKVRYMFLNIKRKIF